MKSDYSVPHIPGQWSDWSAWPPCPCTTSGCLRSRSRLCQIADARCGEDCQGEETESQPCCSAGAPCGEGEGDCDSDSDCAGDLVCGSGNCPQTVPGPTKISDCCVRMEERCQAVTSTDANCCTSDSPCKARIHFICLGKSFAHRRRGRLLTRRTK